jgi:uncharacterized protein YndB with AHSA1/START domain
MAVIDESIFIPRSPQEVFDYISRAETFPTWDASVLEAEQVTEGERGVGTRLRGVNKILGRRFPWVAEFVEFTPPNRLVSRSVEGPLHFTITETIQPEERGSRFTWHADADAGLGGIFGKLADPLVEKAQARTVRNNLETLTEVLTEHRDSEV